MKEINWNAVSTLRFSATYIEPVVVLDDAMFRMTFKRDMFPDCVPQLLHHSHLPFVDILRQVIDQGVTDEHDYQLIWKDGWTLYILERPIKKPILEEDEIEQARRNGL